MKKFVVRNIRPYINILIGVYSTLEKAKVIAEQECNLQSEIFRMEIAEVEEDAVRTVRVIGFFRKCIKGDELIAKWRETI